MIAVRFRIAAALCVTISARNAPAQQPSMYQLESASLYKVAETAEWPKRAIPNEHAKLSICVFGGNQDFIDVLHATLAGKSIREHPLEVRSVQSANELKSCQIAFIRGTTVNRGLLAELQSTSVLSVGEDKKFLAEGGMIDLVAEGEHTHLELNTAAIERANIRYRRDSGAGEGPEIETDNARPLKVRSLPAYPPIARQMKLTGSVRLELTIKPDGSVRDVRVLGGHPLLADTAAKCAKQWRFEPAAAETREMVQISFQSDNDN
jgi:TonB family protein